MTTDDLDRIAGEMEAIRAEWALKCVAIIDHKLAGALAHAQKAVTDTLRKTEDGRPTVRKAQRSISYAAAVSRLMELLRSLAGDSVLSLGGLVRQCREDAYRRAFDLHRPLIPPELWVGKDPKPTLENVRLVRGAALHGYDPRTELMAPIKAAIQQLGAAVALAGSRGTDGADLLEAWHIRTRRSLEKSVMSLLSDSVEHANNQAMADLIHPDHKAEPVVSESS